MTDDDLRNLRPGFAEQLRRGAPIRMTALTFVSGPDCPGRYFRFVLRFQPVDATQALNRSAGDSNSSVSLGRSFNCRATALSFACE